MSWMGVKYTGLKSTCIYACVQACIHVYMYENPHTGTLFIVMATVSKFSHSLPFKISLFSLRKFHSYI